MSGAGYSIDGKSSIWGASGAINQDLSSSPVYGKSALATLADMPPQKLVIVAVAVVAVVAVVMKLKRR